VLWLVTATHTPYSQILINPYLDVRVQNCTNDIGFTKTRPTGCFYDMRPSCNYKLNTNTSSCLPEWVVLSIYRECMFPQCDAIQTHAHQMTSCEDHSMTYTLCRSLFQPHFWPESKTKKGISQWAILAGIFVDYSSNSVNTRGQWRVLISMNCIMWCHNEVLATTISDYLHRCMQLGSAVWLVGSCLPALCFNSFQTIVFS